MLRSITIVFILLALLSVPEFALSTKLKSSWKNPDANSSSLKFEKVLVVAVIGQEFTRKVAEDKVVKILKEGNSTANAIPSYLVLGQEELKDKDSAKAKITEMGFDGAIVLKYAGSQDQRKYDPGEGESVWYPYVGFWGFYSEGWGAVYNATTPNDLKVLIETMLYSIKEDKLIWAGISETKNPKNPAKVVAEIAEETTKHLQKEGLIPKRKN
ncbi:MAG TPA: hypothetical protein VLH08_19485 [Acidobacteriota bacterium]|nr:hypothetical protein [Acidobacteriota bacterium]